MNLLAIDTSTAQASIALNLNGLLYQQQVDAVDEHARGILGLIRDLLIEAKSSIKQLDGIVFGRGPGSFTGLRIACSVAKGLAYAHNLPLYPVSGLAAIAYHVRQSQSLPVLAALDARMQQVYWGFFADDTFSAIESVSNALDIVIPNDEPLILAGVGWESYVPEMPQSLRKRLLKTLVQYPTASDLIALVTSIAITPTTAAEAQPVYIRHHVTQGAVLNG